jgi:hypothetical protein
MRCFSFPNRKEKSIQRTRVELALHQQHFSVARNFHTALHAGPSSLASTFGGCRRSCRQKDRNTLAATRWRSARQWILCTVFFAVSLCRRERPSSLFYLRIPTFCAAPLRRCESIPVWFFSVIYGCRILQGAEAAFRRNSDKPPRCREGDGKKKRSRVSLIVGHFVAASVVLRSTLWYASIHHWPP